MLNAETTKMKKFVAILLACL